jgi:hypothetical protein
MTKFLVADGERYQLDDDVDLPQLSDQIAASMKDNGGTVIVNATVAANKLPAMLFLNGRCLGSVLVYDAGSPEPVLDQAL